MVFEIAFGEVANDRRNWAMFDTDRRALTPICTGEIYRVSTAGVDEAFVVFNALQRRSEPTIIPVTSDGKGKTSQEVEQTLTDDTCATDTVLQAYGSLLASRGTQHVA